MWNSFLLLSFSFTTSRLSAIVMWNSFLFFPISHYYVLNAVFSNAHSQISPQAKHFSCFQYVRHPVFDVQFLIRLVYCCSLEIVEIASLYLYTCVHGWQQCFLFVVVYGICCSFLTLLFVFPIRVFACLYGARNRDIRMQHSQFSPFISWSFSGCINNESDSYMSFPYACSLYSHLAFVCDLQTFLHMDGWFVRLLHLFILLFPKASVFLVGLGSVNAQMEEDPFFHEGRAL